MRWTPLQKLKALEREDLEAQVWPERKRRIREGWGRLVAWERGLSRTLRQMGRLVTTAGLLYGTMQRPVRLLVRMYRARSVGQAELPKSGVASTAEDFVKGPRGH